MYHKMMMSMFAKSWTMICLLVSISSYSETCSNKFKAKGQVIAQKCINHSLNPLSKILDCHTSIKFLTSNNKCLLSELTIDENHFKGGYPEGLLGGSRVDLNIDEFWEIELCKIENKIKRCQPGPPGSYVFGTKLNL